MPGSTLAAVRGDGKLSMNVRGLDVEFFNYVMVLASVIIGLGLAHLLQGVAGIVQHPDREKIYWVHLVWVAATFLLILF